MPHPRTMERRARTIGWTLALSLTAGGCEVIVVGSAGDPRLVDAGGAVRPFGVPDAGHAEGGPADTGPPVVVTLPACIGYTVTVESGVMADGVWADPVLPVVPLTNGVIEGTMTLVLTARTTCASVGLDNARDATGTPLAQVDALGQPHAECVVPQHALGDPMAPDALAWSYVPAAMDGAPVQSPTLAHVGQPPRGSFERIHLGRSFYGDCTAAPVRVTAPSTRIGAYCETMFPPQLVALGLYDIVEGNAAACGGLACFVYQHTLGMPTVHSCSCRCSDASGTPDPDCPCPHGFACVQEMVAGPSALRGGYCVAQVFVPVDGGVVITP